jgi:hypothetical protein
VLYVLLLLFLCFVCLRSVLCSQCFLCQCLLSSTSRRAVQLFGLSLVNLMYPEIPLMHCQCIVSIYNGIDKCAGLFAKKLQGSIQRVAQRVSRWKIEDILYEGLSGYNAKSLAIVGNVLGECHASCIVLFVSIFPCKTRISCGTSILLNVRETRRGNREWIIQRHRKHWENQIR